MSKPAAFFENLYTRNPDPWGFATSPYEQAKYRATLAALPRARFGAALEVGCSIGVFTQLLAGRCDSLLALDISPTALRAARQRCAELTHVEIARRTVPEEWPDGRFDLIVLSEVLYFLDAEAIDRTAALARRSLADAGCLVLVNWRGDTDTPLSGEAAADRFLAALPPGASVTTERAPQYRLDRVSA